MHNWVSVFAAFPVFIFLNLHLTTMFKTDTYAKTSGNLHFQSCARTLYLFTCVENMFLNFQCVVHFVDHNYYSHGFVFQRGLNNIRLSCLFISWSRILLFLIFFFFFKLPVKREKKHGNKLVITINSLVLSFLALFLVDANWIKCKEKSSLNKLFQHK